jgi:thiopeptide-type bacteriocin biosynthesis protein
MLPIDFENVLSVESFLGVVQRRKTVTLSELFPTPCNLLARGAEGRFHHELIVPFHRVAGANAKSEGATHRGRSASQLDHAKRPGSEWLFAKLYCTRSDADWIVTELVLPFAHELQTRHLIDRWHFVRYADPDWHLRVRFRGDPEDIWRQVAARLFARVSGHGSFISRVVIDTYDPEEGRYGGKSAMSVAEKVFEVDSLTAASIIKEFRHDHEARWQLTLLGMDTLLDDLGLSTAEKRQVVRIPSVQHNALIGNVTLHPTLGLKYRKLRPLLEDLFAAPHTHHPKGARDLAQRSAILQESLRGLRELETNGLLACPLIAIARSYLHMWANRMFADAQNAHEFVLYEFLARRYASIIARLA